MIRVLICATFLNLIFLVTQGCDTLGNYQRAFAYETNQRATLPHVELQSGQAPLPLRVVCTGRVTTRENLAPRRS